MHSKLLKIFFLLLILFSACRKPEFTFSEQGDLSFSSDTVKFDSLFVSLLSPTKRLIVTNNSGKNLRISEIYLQGGNASPFSLIIDGVDTNKVSNYELLKKDSLYIFVKFQIPPGASGEITDYIVFKVGEQVQKVLLLAEVLDGYLLKDTVLSCNYVFPTDKPVIIDGYCIVDSNCSVTIPAGAKVYFSSRSDANGYKYSGIYVFGTLKVLGTPGNKVLFTSTRLDEDYLYVAGQWNGIHFLRSSTDNEILYAEIRNGTNGIRVDSSSENGNPKLILRGTEVRDFSNNGLLLLGYSEASLANRLDVYVENTLVHNCGASCVGIFGAGAYVFMNCTFANYDYDFRRESPAFGVQNYLKSLGKVYDLHLEILNTVIWGTENEELVFDLTGGALQEIVIKNSDIKATKITGLDASVLQNVNPRFVNPTNRNDTISFALQQGSPLIDAGSDFGGSAPATDILGNARTGTPDIGAYEFIP